jgi:AbrB family looped-hinge helix DNA binding protein
VTTQPVKITKKGQVTIPREIRDKLNATVVYFEVVEGDIMLRAVKDAGGVLSKYAANAGPGVTMKRMKDRAWEEAVYEKAGKEPA